MLLYIRIALIVLGFTLLNYPLFSADDESNSSTKGEENKKGEKKRKVDGEKKLSEQETAWIYEIQAILDILSDPTQEHSKKIESATQRIRLRFYDHLPGSNITKDQQFWQRIITQDFQEKNQKTIEAVETKLKQLIININTNEIPDRGTGARKKPRTHKSPPKTHSLKEGQKKPSSPHFSKAQQSHQQQKHDHSHPIKEKEKGFPPHFLQEQHKAEKNPYELTSRGPEEKWRWRTNFNIQYNDGEHSEILNFTETHKNLIGIRKQIEGLGSEYMKTDSPNVIVPAISVIYKTKDEKIKNVTSYMPNITPTPNRWDNNYVSFLSGLGTKDMPVDTNIVSKKFHLNKGSTLDINEGPMKIYLKDFYSLLEDSPLNQFRKFILGTLDQKFQSLHEVNFGTYFYHSEQWLIYYLSSPIPRQLGLQGLPKKYGNLCTSIIEILSQANTKEIKEVLGVIFHIESTHDICDVCSPTLSVFLEKLSHSKIKIVQLLEALPDVEKLKKRFAFMKDITVSPNIGFFIMVSSYRYDLAQAKLREYYNPHHNRHKGERRLYYGKDQQTNHDSPTELNSHIPYLYVQVPVNEDGDTVKLP